MPNFPFLGPGYEPQGLQMPFLEAGGDLRPPPTITPYSMRPLIRPPITMYRQPEPLSRPGLGELNESDLYNLMYEMSPKQLREKGVKPKGDE